MPNSVAAERMPAGPLPFLTAEAIAGACATASLPVAAVPELQAAGARIETDKELRALAWQYHQHLFGDSSVRPNLGNLPDVEDVWGDFAKTFYLLIVLSGLPQAEAFHAGRCIPDDVRRATYADIALWATEMHTDSGVWGIRKALIGWFLNHLRGDLYRLNRLQFMQRPFPGKIVAFRHRSSGEVVALAEDGIRFRADGQIDGAGKVYDDDGAWTSRLTETEESARGNAIDPDGFAVNKELFLPSSEWQVVLRRGDPMLDMHIPAGEPMDYDNCGDSIQRALAFFPRHFPDRPFRGFCCTSWILDNQLPDLLPPKSNLVRFLHEFYNFPILTDGMQTWERVFGGLPDDLTTAPRDTTLRRAILDHVLAGGHVRSGGVFLLTEDFAWGQQVYRRAAQVANP